MVIKEYGHIKPREIKCNHCGAILEYTVADVKVKFHNDENWYILKCPVCGKGIRIYPDEEQKEIINEYSIS